MLNRSEMVAVHGLPFTILRHNSSSSVITPSSELQLLYKSVMFDNNVLSTYGRCSDSGLQKNYIMSFATLIL
jgi:hypothetical protein